MSASADGIGDIACSDRETLRIVTEQFVPVDENGNALVNCSILPTDHVPTVIGTAEVIFANCTMNAEAVEQSICTVRIVEAVANGNVYYIAIGWFDHVDADALDDLLAQDETFLPIGLPCDFARCEVRAPINVETMLAAE